MRKKIVMSVAAVAFAACLAQPGTATAAYAPERAFATVGTPVANKPVAPASAVAFNLIDWLIDTWAENQCQRYGNYCG